MSQQYSGYQPQQYQMPQQQAPQQRPAMQEVKFYKSGFFGIFSAAGKFQRDSQRMTAQGWRLTHSAFLGTNFWMQRVVVATYER